MPGQNDARQYDGPAGFDQLERNARRVPPLHAGYFDRPEYFSPPPFEGNIRRTTPPPPGYFDRLQPYRDEYQPPYRPEAWRPERTYYEGTSSPERYAYTRPADENPWVRQSLRSPTVTPWPERRTSQNFNDDSWTRPPRRDMLAQPMLVPSDNWKQSHGMSPDHHERRWAYENRTPELIGRERERSPERAPVRDHHSPPSYPPADRYRKTSQGSDTRDSHSYGPRSDSYRSQYNDQHAWSVGPYYTPESYANNLDGRPREPQRTSYWETRGITRHDHSEPFYRRERSVSAGSGHDELGPSMYRNRSGFQERGPEYLSPAPRWNSRGGSPIVPPRTPHSRMSSNSYTSPRHVYSRSRSTSQSSRDSHAPRPSAKVTFSSNDETRLRSWTSELPSRPSDDREEMLVPLTQPSGQVSTNQASDPSLSPRTSPHPISLKASPMALPVPDYSVHSNVLPPTTADADTHEDHQPHDDLVHDSLRGPQMLDEQPAAEPSVPHISMDRHVSPVLHRDLSRSDVSLAVHEESAAVNSASSVPEAPMEERSMEVEVEPTQPVEQIDPAAHIEPMPMYEALRVLVMVRLQQDEQTREQRVDPILVDNLRKAEPIPLSTSTPETVVREVLAGSASRAREHFFQATKQSLAMRFARRQTDLYDKIRKLREEYMTLHEQWLVHCTKLDEVAKNQALQEAAATAGRTTRRSLATMGDAVRSDLEMEQIIASLGTEEMTDANLLGAKNAAVIPDMLSVEIGEIESVFDDTNNEVHNPAEYYAPRTGFEDWTEDEVYTFVEKFAEFPKQFGIIADFLPHKTPSQCVSFYYLHKHKHIDFRKVVARRAVKRKRGNRKQKSNALLADIRQRDDEVTAPARRRRTVLLPIPEPRKGPRRGVALNENTPTATPTPEPEGEPRKRRRRITARIPTAEEDEGNNDEEDNDPKPVKRARKPRKSRQPSATPLSTPTVADDIPPFARLAAVDQAESLSSSALDVVASNWSESDKELFIHLFARHGADFERISSLMPTKTPSEVAQFCKANVAEGLVPPFHGPGSAVAEDSAGYENNMSVSRGTSGDSTPISATPPISMHMRHPPLEPIHTPYGAPRPYVPILPRGHSLPHPAQYPAINSMSHLALPPMSRPDDHIANPSPFASPSFSNYSFSHLTTPAFPPAPPPLSDIRLPRSSSSGSGEVPTSSASMAFDTVPSFVPAPQAWTRAPLQTADDLAAYLEHRTQLSRQ